MVRIAPDLSSGVKVTRVINDIRDLPMPYSATIVQADGGSWKAQPDENGPVRVYIPPFPFAEWQNRYCTGAASTGSASCAIVVDRGVQKPKIDEDRNLVLDKNTPVMLHTERKVVAQVYGEYSPSDFASILRGVSLFYRSVCLNVVANQTGIAIIGAILNLPNREHMRLCLRSGRMDQMSVSYKDMYGYAITQDTREAFFSALSDWVNQDKPEHRFEAPNSVRESCMALIRSESGHLPSDVSPSTLRGFAMTAAIHASRQAQTAGRTPQKPAPNGADYKPKDPRKDPPKGKDAWWGYVTR